MFNHDFNDNILDARDHRPWRMPDRPWAMTQTWHNLLFAHWPVERSQIEPLIPRPFSLDLFGGNAWIGVVPFYMSNVAPRGIPSVPWVSAFAELNVRTYVRIEDRPGVYFFSLDAASWLAVRAARAFFNLPYHTAAMSVVVGPSETIRYHSRRRPDNAGEFQATYSAIGSSFVAESGSLEHFLTERYCLYHISHSGLPYRLEIHHPPWSLQPAKASVERNTMAAVNGIALPEAGPLLHFVKRQDMVAWMPITV